MRILDDVAPLLVVVLSGLLILAPPIGLWRARRPNAAPGPTWRGAVLVLFGPSLAAFALLVLVWLPAYSGQCGGWLGETSPCSGFGQYAAETLFWAATGLSVPGGLGISLGVIVLIVRAIGRRRSRPRR